MATYAIGDVQGCFADLEALLRVIQFDPAKDKLWFTGDLVNRGPQSLEVLRYIKALGDCQRTVLGNHDLHLLAVAYGVKAPRAGDTLDDILHAPDRASLIDWLRQQPLLHYDLAKQIVMVHAGLAPMWPIEKACLLAREVEAVLQGDMPENFLHHMYGNQPDRWDDSLTGVDRLRCITNYLTRLRFCHQDGRIDLVYKGQIDGKPDNLIPWFDVSQNNHNQLKIIFGHWAALNGKTDRSNLYALDTGCVWGNCLTALRLEDDVRFSVNCRRA